MSARVDGRAPAAAVVVVLLALAACGNNRSAPSSPVRPAASARPAAPANAWTVPVRAGAAATADSGTLVARLARSGPPVALLYEFGTPVFEADARTPRRTVNCTRPWGVCDLQGIPVPLPDEARPAPGSDGALVVEDRDARRAYEFFEARRLPDGNWTTGWGSVTPLDGDGRKGETGSGTSLLAGLVRTDEVRAGRIDHALQLASAFTCRDRVVYPAVKTDGDEVRPDCLPMGARLQLDPSVDVAALPGLGPAERAVAVAWQRYGGYVQNSAGAPLVVGFENPAGEDDPYPKAGLPYDYAALAGIPLDRLLVVAP
jgi:hypothetical protein